MYTCVLCSVHVPSWDCVRLTESIHKFVRFLCAFEQLLHTHSGTYRYDDILGDIRDNILICKGKVLMFKFIYSILCLIAKARAFIYSLLHICEM